MHMTQSPAAGHGAASPAVFSPAEIEEFHADDRNMAGTFITLMVAIFVMGLLGYIGVAIWVSS